MHEVSIREFRGFSAEKIEERLPLIITVDGIPRFIVIDYRAAEEIAERKKERSGEKSFQKKFLQDEWIELSRPSWERVLKEAEEKGDIERANYARWMLEDVLK